MRDAAVARGFFLGDYQALTAGKSFHAVWVATLLPRAADPAARQPDVFTVAIKP